MEKLKLLEGFDFFQVIPRINGLKLRSQVSLSSRSSTERGPPRFIEFSEVTVSQGR